MSRFFSNATRWVTTILLICILVRVFMYFYLRVEDKRVLDLTDASVAVLGFFCAFVLYSYSKILLGKRNHDKSG
jgi:hypothetical protein